ncbi:MAG: glycosyltransferase family 2 protein [Nanoarchaeota archaeon]|nr:glycosyltransferase family 2 protein [Nanoarchaeota archaeon]
MEKDVETSIILPCLNEEQGVGFCIDKIKKVIEQNQINAEIIVVDNGSVDNSCKIIKGKNVNLILQPKKGYGNAYLSGIESAKGNLLIMGDSDGSYDFSEIPKFLSELKNGNDFVIGNRFNKIENRAMPFLHRYIGNPILRMMLRAHGLKINEVCTGFIGVKKEKILEMNLKEQGMEFSSEILTKAVQNDLRIKEIPITYHKRFGESKLRTFRDGFRHFKFLVGF